MPRVNLTEADRENRRVKSEIARAMEYYGLQDDDVADRLEICRTTWWKRKNKPETMTLKEIRMLNRIMPGIKIIGG